MSTFGLDGVLPWTQARHIAANAAHRLPTAAARLSEAVGSILARPVTTIADDPPADSAAYDGFALCGEGPWRLDPDAGVLTPGHACATRSGRLLPGHTDAVLAASEAMFTHLDGEDRLVGIDPLTQLADERARPDLGQGIVRQGALSSAGHHLLTEGMLVGSAAVAMAAAAGLEELEVIPPPVVGTLVLGGHLLERGVPREGRPRDALGPSIPGFVGALGARGNPAIRASDTRELLLGEIDDAAVDLLITTGSTAPEPGNHLRSVLRDLDARWLVDGVAATPGAQMLLARLPDGRLLVGLPGDPVAAMAGLVTLVSPLVRALRGDQPDDRLGTAVLMDDAPLADYADDTALVPVRLEVTAAAVLAHPLAAGLPGWAAADAIAVVSPGGGQRGDVVGLLDPLGRAMRLA